MGDLGVASNPVIPTKKLTQDRPKNLKEIENLAILKSETQDWIELQDVDDYFLLRFLRARNLSVKKAKEMLRKYFELRKTNKYFQDIFQESYFPPDFVFNNIVPFEQSFDMDGRIAVISKTGHIPVKDIFESVGKDELIRVGLYATEFAVHLAEKQRKQYGCTKVIGVSDLEGLSFRNMFFPQSISTAIYCAKIFESCYPEMLHLSIVINANWVYHMGYKILKPFFSQATLDKLQIYGRDPNTWKPALKKYLPENVIPEEYGGTGPPLRYATAEEFQGFHPKL